AAIDSSRAQINADKAALENARVLLSYTDIRSPIEGKTGNLMIKQGNIVQANTTELIAINEIQPIYVTFGVPESTLSGIKRYMAGGKLPVAVTTQDAE